MKDLIFVGMDFVNEPKKILEKMEDKICCDMSPDQRLVYRYGVQTVLDLIDGIVNNSEDMFIHINNLDGQEEFLLEDLLKEDDYE